MRRIKKIISAMLAVAVMIVMAAAVPVSADGSTGSITITNAKAGTTYTAYKIFDATGSGSAVAYTTDEDGAKVIKDDTNAPFTVDAKYNVEKKNDASDAEIIAWLSNNYKSFDSTGIDNDEAASNGNYVISGLSYGYYYISAGNGSAISIDTYTGPDKSLAVKDTEGPNTPDKKITAEDGTGISGGKTENNAKVGSTETFSVTYNATNYVNKEGDDGVKATQIENFYIKDTPTGLAINKDSLEVKVNDRLLSETLGEYQASVADNGTLTITIPWVDSSKASLYEPDDTKNPNYGNIPVTVTYNATVTAAAATQVAENEVHIYYNHESSSTSNGEEVTTGTPPKTTTYTYKFQLNKVDGDNVDENNNKAPLEGAQFELYDGNEKVALILDNGVYRVAKANETTNTIINMTSTSTIEIKGLDNKNYTLKEIKAPAGYTLAKDTTIFAADSTESTTNKLVRVDEESYGTVAGNDGNITIENKAGSILPSTGGIGTTIFYVLGALLIIGAGVVLIARRRMNSNQ